jgi:hypothetical protein
MEHLATTMIRAAQMLLHLLVEDNPVIKASGTFATASRMLRVYECRETSPKRSKALQIPGIVAFMRDSQSTLASTILRDVTLMK